MPECFMINRFRVIYESGLLILHRASYLFTYGTLKGCMGPYVEVLFVIAKEKN